MILKTSDGASSTLTTDWRRSFFSFAVVMNMDGRLINRALAWLARLGSVF